MYQPYLLIYLLIALKFVPLLKQQIIQRILKDYKYKIRPDLVYSR
jgi:hypothetical protein